jgi:hypothetical protein
MSDSIPSSIPIVWGHVGSLKSRLIGLMDHKEHVYFVFGISARSVGEDGFVEGHRTTKWPHLGAPMGSEM